MSKKHPEASWEFRGLKSNNVPITGYLVSVRTTDVRVDEKKVLSIRQLIERGKSHRMRQKMCLQTKAREKFMI